MADDYGFGNNFGSNWGTDDYTTAYGDGSTGTVVNNTIAGVNGGAGAGEGFSAMSLIPALTSLVGVAGTMKDIEAKNEALMVNMRNQATNFEAQQGSTMQQLADLDAILGDKLSASGLEAMKTEGRLKAASAETGATGTSNVEAQQTAQVNRLHNEAALLRTYDVQKASTQQSLIAQRLNFEGNLDAMISGQQSPLSAFLQTANAGLSGMNQGINMLNASQREQFFNTNTTGVA